jgi:hypothetical protein
MEKVLTGNSRSKGQFFIIGAIIILVGFIMLRNLFVYPSIEEKRSLESSLVDRYLDNIAKEYRNIVGLASLQSDVNSSGIAYLSNFSFFIRDGIESRILYVFVYLNSSSYSVTVGNFLNDKINVTITATGSTPGSYSIGVLNDKTNQTREFVANSDTIELTLTYNRIGSEFNETIPIKKTNSFVQGFFDISLEEDDIFLRKIDLYNRTW